MDLITVAMVSVVVTIAVTVHARLTSMVFHIVVRPSVKNVHKRGQTANQHYVFVIMKLQEYIMTRPHNKKLHFVQRGRHSMVLVVAYVMIANNLPAI